MAEPLVQVGLWQVPTQGREPRAGANLIISHASRRVKQNPWQDRHLHGLVPNLRGQGPRPANRLIFFLVLLLASPRQPGSPHKSPPRPDAALAGLRTMDSSGAILFVLFPWPPQCAFPIPALSGFEQGRRHLPSLKTHQLITTPKAMAPARNPAVISKSIRN